MKGAGRARPDLNNFLRENVPDSCVNDKIKQNFARRETERGEQGQTRSGDYELKV